MSSAALCHFLGTAAHQAHGGNRPVDDTGFHAGVARVAQRYGDMRFLHGEDIAPALEMAVAQDAAAYNRQVSVGTAGVMGELCHKVKNFSQGMAVPISMGLWLSFSMMQCSWK